jgi:hypothetical protein
VHAAAHARSDLSICLPSSTPPPTPSTAAPLTPRSAAHSCQSRTQRVDSLRLLRVKHYAAGSTTSICPLSAGRLIAQSGRLHRMEQSQSPQMKSVCRPHTHFGNQDRADLPSKIALPRPRQDPLPRCARVLCSVCCHPTHTAPELLPPDACYSDSDTDISALSDSAGW